MTTRQKRLGHCIANRSRCTCDQSHTAARTMRRALANTYMPGWRRTLTAGYRSHPCPRRCISGQGNPDTGTVRIIPAQRYQTRMYGKSAPFTASLTHPAAAAPPCRFRPDFRLSNRRIWPLGPWDTILPGAAAWEEADPVAQAPGANKLKESTSPERRHEQKIGLVQPTKTGF